MLSAEWWAFELMVILAGILGITEQAANVILFNVVAVFYMIPLGMQEASCALIGNEIGANNPKLAKKYYKVISTITFLCLIVICLLMGFGRKIIASVFTDDIKVQNMTASVLIVLSVTILFDGLMCYSQGPVKALGLQSKGACISLASFYIVSVPFAAIFAFWCDWNIYGLWIGFYSGIIL